MSTSAILSTAYFGPVSYYQKFTENDNIIIEAHENYPKQTYRNRCHILSANGPLALSYPVSKHAEKCNIKDLKISYHDLWQKNHFKAIESAYRSAPYYIYYMDEFEIFFQKKWTFLFDFNVAIHKAICGLLGISGNFTESESYIHHYANQINDYRESIHPKKNVISQPTLPEYQQVFSTKFSFVPDLSILDLLFNQGPDSLAYLKKNRSSEN